MYIFVSVIFYKSHFVLKKFLLYLILKSIFTSPLISTIFFLTSSPSFFSRRYVSYTGSKDETVRIWGISKQVVIFIIIIIIIIILLVHLVLKIKCCREIITTGVIMFISKYMLIFFFFRENKYMLIWFGVFISFIFKSSIYTSLNSMKRFM